MNQVGNVKDGCRSKSARRSSEMAVPNLDLPFLTPRVRKAITKHHDDCARAAGTLFKANLMTASQFDRVRKKIDLRRIENP